MAQSILRSFRAMFRLKVKPAACEIARVIRNPFLAALLLMVCVLPARGACLHWKKFVGRSDESAVYMGNLDDHPIRMMLHLDVTTGHFEGTYGYNDQSGVLKLSGYMRADETGADLEERNAQGQVTGYFSLAFFEPRSNWGGSWDFFKKNMKRYPSECNFLTGAWHPAPWDGKPSELVTLQQVGPAIDPTNNKARLQNEATAYQFMQALLHDDREKVVSLLHYPFHSFDNGQNGGGPKTWSAPESVLHSYGRIMPPMKSFTSEQLQLQAVPHILFTDNSGVTNFMNGSIYIYKGKITWICAGKCPVIPEIEVMGKPPSRR